MNGLSREYAWCMLFIPALAMYVSILTGTVNNYDFDSILPLDISFGPSGRVLFAKGTPVEILGTGFGWSEGPLWVEDSDGGSGHLVFSDTITNQIWRHDQGNGIFTLGKSLHIEESGCASNVSWCEEVFEPGSNGITRYPMASAADLVVCQHGERAITMLFENGTRKVIADTYKGKKLNSPNDLIWSSDNNLYFTDPPYGLFDRASKSTILDEQIGHYGVYMILKKDIETALRTGVPTDNVILLDSSLSRPNGLAFSPDFGTLYVSNSDSTEPVWLAFDVDRTTGIIRNRKVLVDARVYKGEIEEYSAASFPDGFKVSSDGIIVTSAPGGLFLLLPDGNLLAKIAISRLVSNVAFGSDGYLYVTASDAVLRIRTTMTGSNEYQWQQ
jgi:gluconolactonase